MLTRAIYAGIAAPDWRRGLIRSTQAGCASVLLGLLIAFTLSRVFPEGLGPLAGDELFQKSSMAVVTLVALVWAPCFETIVAQLLPISFIRLFTKADLPAVVFSALVFGLGHVAGGGGPVQGMVTAATGSIFAFVYVANIEFGAWRASVLSAWAHCVNNALGLLAATTLT